MNVPAHAFLLVATLMAADLKIDHVTIAGRDLKQLQQMFAAAGLPTEYGGKHTNGLTEMAFASFADGSYVELIAAQTQAGAAAHYWGKFIDGDAGPCAWAISTPDLSTETRRLQSAGATIQSAKGGRQRPDGVSLAWESASVGSGPQGSFFPFLIHDLTPRELRAFPRGEPTLPQISGVGLVVIGVRDLEDGINRYQRVFGLAKPDRQDDTRLQLHLAAFAGTPVVLAAPLGPTSPLAARLDKFGEAPCAFVLVQAAGSPAGGAASQWFGRSVVWIAGPKTGAKWIGIRALRSNQ
jgi:catechol 2,3-dioxygenase-like lactoylglutathione lyase family enzyme